MSRAALETMFFGVIAVLVVSLLLVLAMAISREPEPTACAPERDGLTLVYVETDAGGTLTGCVYSVEVRE